MSTAVIPASYIESTPSRLVDLVAGFQRFLSRYAVLRSAVRSESATRYDEAEALLLNANNRRVSETIADKAKELSVDLIIIGRHGQRGLATLILGSVAEQLAKISDASVLLVRKH